MDYRARIIHELKTSSIKGVVLIDDAFDAPDLTDDDHGALLDILAGPPEPLEEIEISRDLAAAARSALATDPEHEDVQKCWELLYASFVDQRGGFDPGNRFDVLQGQNVAAIRPLLRLLEEGHVHTTRLGGNASERDFKSLDAQIVFLDYYFEKDGPGSSQSNAAKVESSGIVLRKLLKDWEPGGPNIVLMSSDKTVLANDFRVNEGRDKLAQSRFHFLCKQDLSLRAEGVVIERDAAHALLEAAQTQSFAHALALGLDEWQRSLTDSLQRVWRDVNEMEIRDFAYLARFRLAEEGQSFDGYLEWFLGELFLDRVGRALSDASRFQELGITQGTKIVGGRIEGMFDGASSRIAELYSDVRISMRRRRGRGDWRMGDLLRVGGSDVMVVLTPNCDLILRKDGRKAKRLLTMRGKLKKVSDPDTTMADFIQLNDQPFSIKWNFKDIETKPFEVGEGDPDPYIGTLRSMYAYELQRRALEDIGRVGLAVAPAMGVNATAKVFLQTKNNGQPIHLPLAEDDTAVCSVILGRAGSGDARVVFQRGFVESMLQAVLAAPKDGGRKKEGAGDEETRENERKIAKETKNLAEWQKVKATLEGRQTAFDKLCHEGVEAGETSAAVRVSVGGKPIPGCVCQILVKVLDLDAKASR